MEKKKKILVLPTVEHIDEIASGLNQEVEITKGSFSKMEFSITDNIVMFLHDESDIKEFDSVWLSSYWGTRDLAYAVKQYLTHHNINHTFVEESTSKVTDQVQFALNGLRAPNTYFVDRKNISDYVEKIEEICGYPLVMKDIKGSRGMYCKLVNNREELLKEYANLPETRKYVFQTYIPNEYDWGVMVVNGKVLSAEKSYSAESAFLNNACNGATEVFIPLEDVPQNICDIAIHASDVLNLKWSRSDIIIDKETNEPYLLEVNRCPGITRDTTEVIGARTFLKSLLETS